MANRHRNRNQNYGRGNYGGRQPQSDRGNYGNRDYEQSRSGSNYGNDYSTDYDRDENYFGSGIQFGEGYQDRNYGRNSDFYDNDYGQDYDTEYSQSSRGYLGNYDRGIDNYYRENNSGRNSNYGRSGGRYNRNDRTDWRNDWDEGDYLESERGYDLRQGSQKRGWWDRTSDEISSWFGDEEAEQRRRMDALRQGQFRGRGPRSYKRSDERIKEEINDRLTDDYNLDASDIEVEVNDRDVVLTGTVNSRYDKRRAEDIAEYVSGVNNVENRLRVNQSTSIYNQGTGSYTSENITSRNQISNTGTTDSTIGSTGTSSSNLSDTTSTTTGKGRSKTA